MKEDLIGAFAMRNDFNELWQQMVSIEAKHMDQRTPWRESEVKLVVKKAKELIRRLPTTHHNEIYKKKALDTIKFIEDGKYDFYKLNNLRDHIHSIWSLGCPDAPTSIRYDEFDEKHKKDSDWDDDKFYDIEDLKFYTADNCPSRGNRNIKKEADIGFVQREYFFYQFIKLSAGKELASRFHTFLHDIYEDRFGAKRYLRDIQLAIKAFNQNLITSKQLTAFTERCLERAISELTFDPSTWGKDDAWRDTSEERQVIKQYLDIETPLTTDCQEINCRETREMTDKQIKDMQDGKGVPIWWCKKHGKRTSSDD